MLVKAGLAICSSLNSHCCVWIVQSVAFMSSHYYWDISSCGIVPGFCKSSHKCANKCFDNV